MAAQQVDQARAIRHESATPSSRHVTERRR
jgi:hypothetical protein